MINLDDVKKMTDSELSEVMNKTIECRKGFVESVKSKIQKILDEIASGRMTVEYVNEDYITFDIVNIPDYIKNRSWSVFQISVDTDWRTQKMTEMNFTVMRMTDTFSVYVNSDDEATTSQRATELAADRELLFIYDKFAYNEEFHNRMKELIETEWSHINDIQHELNMLRDENQIRINAAKKREFEKKNIENTKKYTPEINALVKAGEPVYVRMKQSQSKKTDPQLEWEFTYRGTKYYIAPDTQSDGSVVFMKNTPADIEYGVKYIPCGMLKNHEGKFIFRI